MGNIVIFGLGAAGELAHYYFEQDSPHKVVGFAVDEAYLVDKTFCGLPVVPFERVTSFFPCENHLMFIAVGYKDMNDLRACKMAEAKKQGYRMANYISSRAAVFPDLSHLENCFILENVTVQPFVKIGNNVTIWSGTHIGHHSSVGDNTFISSQIVVSGGVTVGKNCFMGVNATVFEHLTISDYTLVAAGALVNKNTEPYGVYVGMPAKKTPTPSNRLMISK